MRPLILVCVFAASLPAQAARVLAVPVNVDGADPALAVDVDRALADAIRESEAALVPASDAAAVVASVPCDDALPCTLQRGKTANAELVLLARTESTPAGVNVRVRLIDVVARAERGAASAIAPREEVTRAARAAVFQMLAPDRFVGRIAVETSQRGSVVLVDGVMKGSTPMLAALEVPPGRHEVEIRYGDALVLRKFVDVIFDETFRVKVDAGGAEPATTPASSVPSPMLFAGIGLASVGGLALVTGGVMYAIALGQVAAINEGGVSEQDIRDNRTVGTASLVLLGVGVVAAGAGAACIVMAQLE